jgi:hypothetical protein
MKVHVPTKTVFNTEKHAYERGVWSYRQQSGGRAEPQDTIIWSDWDIEEYIILPVDSVTEKRTNDLVDIGEGVYAFTVVPLSAQEIADREKGQLDSDLQQATISSARLLIEVFTHLKDTGVIDISLLSDDAKAEFAKLQALVNQ